MRFLQYAEDPRFPDCCRANGAATASSLSADCRGVLAGPASACDDDGCFVAGVGAFAGGGGAGCVGRMAVGGVVTAAAGAISRAGDGGVQ